MTYDPIDTGPDDNEADREVTIDSLSIADGNKIQNQSQSDQAIVMDSFSLNDDSKGRLIPGQDKGDAFLFIVHIDFGRSAILHTDSNDEAVDILEDPASNWTTTEGNDGTFNAYWDAGNTRFELENKDGGTRNFRRFAMIGDDS